MFCTNRCTKTSQRIPISPTVADYRTCNLLILRVPAVERPTVTAEVASSSVVVPAIFSITYALSPSESLHNCCQRPGSVHITDEVTELPGFKGANNNAAAKPPANCLHLIYNSPPCEALRPL